MRDALAKALPAAPTFIRIYTECFDFAWSTARGLGIDPNEVDDVVQDVFVVVHERLSAVVHPVVFRRVGRRCER